MNLTFPFTNGRGTAGTEARKPARRKPSKRSYDHINDGLDGEEDLVATVKRIWVNGRRRMYPILQQWAMNALFFRGKQRCLWADMPAYKYGDPDPALDEVADIVANVVQKHVLAAIARMTLHDPRYYAFPVTDDENDKDRADLWNMVIPWRARVQDFPGLWLDAVTLANIMGNSFMKTCYDPLAGPLRPPRELSLMPGDQELLQGDEYQGLLERLQNSGFDDMEPTGDVTMHAVPAYEITADNEHVRGLKHCRRLIHSTVVTVQQIKEEFPDHPRLDEISPGAGFHEHYLFFMREILGEETGGIYEGGDNEDDDGSGEGGEKNDAETFCVRHEFYVTRSPKRSHGVRAVVVGEILMTSFEDGEPPPNPYWHGGFPFVHLKATDDKTNFWATCDLEQALPIQAEFNQSLTQVIQSRNRISNPERIFPQGCGINKDNVLGVPGEILEPKLSHADKVRYLEPPNLPAYTDKLIQALRFIIEEIFSDHKPSQGITRSGDSGVKVRALQVADDNRNATVAKQHASALKEFWLQDMMNVAQFTDRDMIGYLMGDQGERSYFSWNRDELLGFGKQPELMAFPEEERRRAQVMALRWEMDLEITIMPAKSSQTVREDAIAMAQARILDPTDPQQRKQMLEMFGYGFEIPRLMSEQRSAAAKAALENDAFLAHQPVEPPKMFELHAEEVRVHKKFTLTGKFKRELSLTEQQQVLDHIERHEIAVLYLEPLRQQYLAQRAVVEAAAVFGPMMPGMATGMPTTGSSQPGQQPTSQGSPAGQAPGFQASPTSGPSAQQASQNTPPPAAMAQAQGGAQQA